MPQTHIGAVGRIRVLAVLRASPCRRRPARARSTYNYYKNGAKFYTSAIAPMYPLRVDPSCFTLGATLKSVILGQGGW